MYIIDQHRPAIKKSNTPRRKDERTKKQNTRSKTDETKGDNLLQLWIKRLDKVEEDLIKNFIQEIIVKSSYYVNEVLYGKYRKFQFKSPKRFTEDDKIQAYILNGTVEYIYILQLATGFIRSEITKNKFQLFTGIGEYKYN